MNQYSEMTMCAKFILPLRSHFLRGVDTSMNTPSIPQRVHPEKVAYNNAFEISQLQP